MNCREARARSGALPTVKSKELWYVAKFLELAGMIIVLAGLAMSISYGLGEDGMRSMQYELRGLTIGGGLFILGWLLEGAVGGR